MCEQHLVHRLCCYQESFLVCHCTPDIKVNVFDSSKVCLVEGSNSDATVGQYGAKEPSWYPQNTNPTYCDDIFLPHYNHGEAKSQSPIGKVLTFSGVSSVRSV